MLLHVDQSVRTDTGQSKMKLNPPRKSKIFASRLPVDTYDQFVGVSPASV
ncbi:hypothetical protein Pan189_10260 [Stratiformator vulcanicus]|uniref:Uncharacterized protein n=1 Tax=Stratiformator vulcanicus TaxID=2527980 RepID=A0A517QYF3_9PLAN|nr:hypothetical protein Pan189_10260 [Stratiformator vulcanicus]